MSDEDRHPDHPAALRLPQALTVNALISAALVAACATFTPGVPFAWIVAVLLVGGFFRSLEFTSINTIAYADVDPRRMSRATSLVAVAQQVSISMGVAIGALAVDLTLRLGADSTAITAADFQPAFIAIALISACAVFVFVRLPPDAGAELARRTRPDAGPDRGDGSEAGVTMRELDCAALTAARPAKSRRQQISSRRIRPAGRRLDVLARWRNRA